MRRGRGGRTVERLVPLDRGSRDHGRSDKAGGESGEEHAGRGGLEKRVGWERE